MFKDWVLCVLRRVLFKARCVLKQCGRYRHAVCYRRVVFKQRWLLTERDIDENGNKILNLETIYDTGLLEELINYNRKGNFDRVMSFMQLMFSIEETYEEEVDKEPYINPNISYLIDNMAGMFKKR